MARIFGTIESLKSLKLELKDKGVSRFNSVKDLKSFLSNYNSEKLEIINQITNNLEREYFETCINLEQSKKTKHDIIKAERLLIAKTLSKLNIKIFELEMNKSDNFFLRIFFTMRTYYLKNKYNQYEKNQISNLENLTKEISEIINKDEFFIKKYKTEKQKIIEKRASKKIAELEHIYNVIQNSRNLIAGAIGENMVVNEINKLSDDYVLINDFNLNFSSPIFFKKYNQRIYSIQIDHLLISKAGIFIIETKNWSKKSVDSLSLRSPIEQIERSNFALYVYLSNNITLRDHHWGEQQIPIRNLIVMVNNKPKEKFKFVNIKLINELNNYIKYFEPVLTNNQFETTINKLV
ncbi:nuclease-related domain-containing protein [Flavicella marina]|uniref:nuclease-related domain-containing protein n=1 Tax=Flavicella marina TaxID=1475951 RepID=UPI00126535AD|nr:nuclease-related domain-containing protein [Flavicella marina]